MPLVRTAIAVADNVARALLVVSGALMLVLIGAMMYEVVARYVFSASTLWAADVSYMSNGAMFVLASAYALMRDDHVRVDVLSVRFPAVVRRAIGLAFDVVLLLPVLLLILHASASAAWKLYVSGERVLSAWEPMAWPFYATLTVGLAALALQVLADALRNAAAIAARKPASTPA
jgi:TRAP-type mannitol/chloroaromatic compound transport system permease small subunit